MGKRIADTVSAAVWHLFPGHVAQLELFSGCQRPRKYAKMEPALGEDFFIRILPTQ